MEFDSRSALALFCVFAIAGSLMLYKPITAALTGLEALAVGTFVSTSSPFGSWNQTPFTSTGSTTTSATSSTTVGATVRDATSTSIVNTSTWWGGVRQWWTGWNFSK